MRQRILASAAAGALALGLIGLAAGPAEATPPQAESGGQPGPHAPNVAPKQQLDAIQRQLRDKTLRETAPDAVSAPQTEAQTETKPPLAD